MIVGIDPGASGAVAWLSDHGSLIEVRDLPHIQVAVGKGHRSRLVPAALAQMMERPGRRPLHAFVEQVATRPGEGAAASFSFGMGFGMILGVLATLGIPYTLVPAKVWKQNLRVPADKGLARQRACQLWPGLASEFSRVKDDGRAESALLGLYGAHQTQGQGSAAA